MKSYQFQKIVPNYHKKVLEIELKCHHQRFYYNLSFSVFHDLMINRENKFKNIEIDHELNDEAVEFVLEDGSQGDFPSDFVLYHCDPTYELSPLNQIKKTLKNEMQGGLSVRVVADALKTSPSQVLRLLKENHVSKQWIQLVKLAKLAGYQLEVSLKKIRTKTRMC